MLKLLDVLLIAGIRPTKYKIHFATGNNPTPLEAFLRGEFKQWQEGQRNKNFPCNEVIGLIKLGADKWLFAGVYQVLGVKQGRKNSYVYSTKLLPGQDDLIGRVIVHFARSFRQSYIWGHRFGGQLEVYEIRPNAVSIQNFPGYNSVNISHDMLKLVIRREEPSWKAALSSVSGVYVIADAKTGKQYVGKAFAKEGIWQRWRTYADSGHGGNKELKSLLSKKGPNYASNFQYSILEVAASNATNDLILDRESYWKDALLTREFGYNSN